MSILEGVMETPRVPVSGRGSHRLCLHGPVRPKGREKGAGGGRPLRPGGPQPGGPRPVSWPLHVLFLLSGTRFLQLLSDHSSSTLVLLYTGVPRPGSPLWFALLPPPGLGQVTPLGPHSAISLFHHSFVHSGL